MCVFSSCIQKKKFSLSFLLYVVFKWLSHTIISVCLHMSMANWINLLNVFQGNQGNADPGRSLCTDVSITSLETVIGSVSVAVIH